jgi:hypothetical protein
MIQKFQKGFYFRFKLNLISSRKLKMMELLMHFNSVRFQVL